MLAQHNRPKVELTSFPGPLEKSNGPGNKASSTFASFPGPFEKSDFSNGPGNEAKVEHNSPMPYFKCICQSTVLDLIPCNCWPFTFHFAS